MPSKEFDFLFFQFLKVGGTIKIFRTFHYTESFLRFFKNLLRWSQAQSHCFL